MNQLVPYVPGEQPQHPKLVKLNTNENPYGPSPKVIAAIQAQATDALRLYPDPNGEKLKQTLADYYAAKTGTRIVPAQVFLGNGSDEVLAHIFHGLFKHAAPLLFPNISYSFYPVYCGLYGIDYQTIALDQQCRIDVDDYIRAANEGPNAGVLFPNPNAPTGCLVALNDIERLLKANRDSVVVIDEAYIDFGGETAIGLVERYDQLLVTQTLSKSRSLAGLRVGFAIGHPDLIEALERIKNSFNSYPLDRLAQAGAIAAFEDEAWFEQTRQQVMADRALVTAELAALGFEVLPSAANFIFVRHPQTDAAQIAAGLRAEGVIVRHFKQPGIEQYLRITVGDAAQNAALLDAMKGFL